MFRLFSEMTSLSMSDSTSQTSIDNILIKEIEEKKRCEMMRISGKTVLPKPPPLIPQQRSAQNKPDIEETGEQSVCESPLMSGSVERQQPYGEQQHNSPHSSSYQRLSYIMAYIRDSHNYDSNSGAPVLLPTGTRDTWHAPSPLSNTGTAIRTSVPDFMQPRLTVLPLNNSWLHSNGTDGCRPGPMNTGKVNESIIIIIFHIWVTALSPHLMYSYNYILFLELFVRPENDFNTDYHYVNHR